MEVYMKTKILMVMMVLLALAMLGLAGCSAGVQAQGAQQPVSVNVNSQQGIWVSGQGIVNVTPDTANLSLGVNAQSIKVVDAQSQAADAMSKVISALTSNGVDKKDIATQNYSINQLTKYDNNTGQSIVTGYQVSNIAAVTIRAIDKVGTIIDAVTAAAGDLTRVNGISFSVDKPAQYNDQARALAMADAKAKAQQLASLAGVTLGTPTYIIENPTNTPITYNLAVPQAASGASVATTPINPGQTQITLTVQVAYAIQ
jgi:uncharacterized protein YggE